VTLGYRILAVQTVAIMALATLAACGGSSPTGPSGGGGGGGGSAPVVGATSSVGPIGATITIGGNSAVSPSQVTIAVGQSVTFVNNDTRSHQMQSDPHPLHTNCPSINNVGLLPAGQSKSTLGFSGTGTCTYHDHNDSSNAALMGRIVIQ
jgi:plastocyanin